MSLKQLLKQGFVATKLTHELLHLGVDLLVNHGRGQRELRLLQGDLQHLFADAGSLLGLGRFLRAGSQVSAQLLHGVKLGGHLSEIVIQLGKLALLHCGHRDGHLGVLVGVLTKHQLGCEGGGLVGLQALHCVIKALNEVAGTNAVGHVFDLGVFNLFAINRGGQVKGDEVLVASLAVNGLQGTKTFAQVLQLVINALLSGTQGWDLDGNLGKVRKVELGANINLGDELDHVAVLQLGDVNVRLAERLNIKLLDGLAVARRQHVVHNLLQDRAAPDARINQLAGCLAATETRNVDLLGQRLVRLVQFGSEFAKRHLNCHLHAGVIELINRALHESFSWNMVCEMNKTKGPFSTKDPSRGNRI